LEDHSLLPAEQSRSMNEKRRISQCDSKLPLLFCIALIPLTHELNMFKREYQVYGNEWKVSHLLYADD